MKTIRHSSERGQGDHGWLRSFHTFSFADYYDPRHTQFRALRVMNEDWVAPGHGFGMHPHRDMEIVTYVLEGELAHKDSLGHGAVLRAGELQRMTAGTGIRHSEINPSPTDTVHLYQIWLLPDQRGLTPSYDQQPLPLDAHPGQWQLAAGPAGAGGILTIHQDARLLLASFGAAQELSYDLAPGRHAWLQVLKGSVSLDGRPLAAGDGVAFSDEPRVQVAGLEPGEVMLFDLA